MFLNHRDALDLDKALLCFGLFSREHSASRFLLVSILKIDNCQCTLEQHVCTMKSSALTTLN